MYVEIEFSSARCLLLSFTRLERGRTGFITEKSTDG